MNVLSAPTAAPRTVLVVEDEADLAAMVVEVLRDEGYRALQAQTGEAALALLAAERVDVLLLDLGLGGVLDGTGVWRHLSELSRPPAVVVASGQQDLPPALQLAGTLHLRKPYDLDALLHVVATHGR